MPVVVSQRPKIWLVTAIPGRQVGQGAPALVFMFNTVRLVERAGRQRWMAAMAGLNRGFFVGRDDEGAFVSPNGLPSHWRAYRSSTRPALASKWGSRGKIHERCCHGFSERSCSQRQIVDADASVTPCSMTSRCSSVREKRPSGRSCLAGSSHATATTSATCCGGKTARAARAWLVGQPLDAVLAESSSPLADDLGMTIAPDCDLGVGQTLGGVECQWPSVSPQLRPSVLPGGGRVVSPLVAIGSP